MILNVVSYLKEVDGRQVLHIKMLRCIYLKRTKKAKVNRQFKVACIECSPTIYAGHTVLSGQ
jgi:hypothetical protein